MHRKKDMEIDPQAYNTLGEHLSNDQKQSRRYLGALFVAALVSIAFLLWMIYWSPS